MIRRARLVRLACVALTALVVTGCRACGQPAALAELVQLAGKASRDYAARPGLFSAAATGATFGIGDGLRTDPITRARLRLRGGSALEVREDTLIRFLADTPSARQRVSLETGAAEIEAGGEGMEFETRFGVAHVDPGAHVRVTADANRMRFEVLIGSAIVESADASSSTLRAGESLDVESPAKKDAGVPPPPGTAQSADPTLDDPTAIVAELTGAGVRHAAPRSTSLLPMEPGVTRLDPGSRLVVPAGAKVVVRRRDERVTVTGAADVIVGTPSGALIQTLSGRVGVDASAAIIHIDVPGGTITVRGTAAAPASADVVLTGSETNVFSHAGTTELRGRKSSIIVSGSEAAWLDRDGAAQKSIVTNEAPLFTTLAGETATIHSLRVPTPVLVRADTTCGSGAYVEVSQGGRFLPAGLTDATDDGVAHAQRAVVLSLGEGSHPYRVRCPDPSMAGASGTFRIVRDSGAARVPRTAGHNALHADGRHYSVLYQNLLPELTLDWPEAPPGEALLLKVRDARNHVDEIALGAASHSFPSGKLSDGTYTFWFQVRRDPRIHSLETTVRIGFDNAAPTAEIHEPQDGFTPIDGKVVVSGVAVEGATIRVGDTVIPLDAQFRFRGEVPVAQGDRSIAIRIEHPTRGVHYYLRRVGGT